MTLCINNSGTWRNITTQCVNNSGTWRKITTGCINQSGTWRKFAFPSISDPFSTSCPLGSPTAGGYLICKSSNVAWILAPSTTEVSRTWYCRNDSVITAQSITGCTGWFVPTCNQIYNPGQQCQIYWEGTQPQQGTPFWSSTERDANTSWCMQFSPSYQAGSPKNSIFRVRSFRCVTY